MDKKQFEEFIDIMRDIRDDGGGIDHTEEINSLTRMVLEVSDSIDRLTNNISDMREDVKTIIEEVYEQILK